MIIVSILTTTSTYAPAHEINDTVMEHLFQAVDIPRREMPTSSSLETRGRQLSEALQNWSAHIKSNIFADNFFMDKDELHWESDISASLAKIGGVIVVAPVAPINQLRGTFYLIGKKAQLKVFFTMTPEATPKIQAMRLEVQPLGTAK